MGVCARIVGNLLRAKTISNPLGWPGLAALVLTLTEGTLSNRQRLESNRQGSPSSHRAHHEHVLISPGIWYPTTQAPLTASAQTRGWA